jgi:acyl-CoA synthetase (AMP-forming)/AMP-acid ligase II
MCSKKRNSCPKQGRFTTCGLSCQLVHHCPRMSVWVCSACSECPCFNKYGTAETAQVSANLPPPGAAKLGTCGIPPKNTVIIVQEDESQAAPGQRGEVCHPASPNLRIVSEKVNHSTSQTATYFFNSLLGEDVAAAVVLQPGSTVTEDDLRKFLSIQLASFKVPLRIVFQDELPKGSTGKLQRQKLGGRS